MPTHLIILPARTAEMSSDLEEVQREYPSGLASDIAKLDRIALRDRWGVALVWIGWVHLAIFLTCQAMYGTGDRAESHFLPLWAVDLVLACLIFRRYLIGPSRGPVPTLLALVGRIWITFFILAFSTASLNKLVGFETDWFKAIWATLSTFGFATMAWIFHLKFLVPAVQMSLTALLIARYPAFAYAIYGVSWCIALNGVGLELERRRVSLLNRDRAVSTRSNSMGRALEIG